MYTHAVKGEVAKVGPERARGINTTRLPPNTPHAPRSTSPSPHLGDLHAVEGEVAEVGPERARVLGAIRSARRRGLIFGHRGDVARDL